MILVYCVLDSSKKSLIASLLKCHLGIVTESRFKQDSRDEAEMHYVDVYLNGNPDGPRNPVSKRAKAKLLRYIGSIVSLRTVDTIDKCTSKKTQLAD